jgi:hypothetical protein
MTPNGAIVFGLAVIAGAVATRHFAGLAIVLALCAAFAAVELRSRAGTALAWSAAIVAPLALVLVLVWVVVVGRSPDEMAAGLAGTRTAAFAYVLTLCLRLFLIALVIQLLVMRFAHVTPLRFVRDLTAPLVAKKLLVLTLSWIDTMLHAVDRSRTALITSGIIAPRLSLRNLANGWILVQTVWLSVITIALGRLRDKWPAENTVARLDQVLHAEALPLARADWLWIGAAAAAIVTTRSCESPLDGAHTLLGRELLRTQRRAARARNATGRLLSRPLCGGRAFGPVQRGRGRDRDLP